MMAMVGFIFITRNKTLARHPAMGKPEPFVHQKRASQRPPPFALLPVHLAAYDLGKYGVRSSTYFLITLNPASVRAEMALSPLGAPTLMIR